MRHLSDGELRRHYDDPDTTVAPRRSHLASCTVCQAHLSAIGSDARQAAELLQVAGAPVDAGAALTEFRLRHQSAGRAAGRPSRVEVPRLRWQLPAAAAALAALVVVLLTVTPFASTLRSLFVPTTVQPVVLTQSDLQSLAPLRNYGTVANPVHASAQTASSAQAAAAASGLPAIQVGALPSAVASQPASYETVSSGTSSFTFSAAKAAAAAAGAGQPTPTFPAGVDGSSLVLQTGPGEAVVYGNEQQIEQALQQAHGSDQQAASQAAATAGTFLVVGEMRAPQLSSTGASVDQIKTVLLAQPGLTAQARALIEQLGNSDGVLPLPVPADLATASPVTVQGVQGQAFGDDTGLGSAIVWIKNGIVYVVGGTVAQSDALSAADSLS